MIAGLFGIQSSNRNFENNNSWGKNQFNSSFPASMLCYMQSIGLKCIYLKFSPDKGVYQDFIDSNEVFGMRFNSPNIHFNFESCFEPFSDVLVGKAPNIDLVVFDKEKNKSIRGLEIKLTAIPDSTTSKQDEKNYGAELVIRQPTIIYLAASIALHFRNKKAELNRILDRDLDKIGNWAIGQDVLLSLPTMLEKLEKICEFIANAQVPLVVQPIWKTRGTTSILTEQCLDCFVWSDVSFIQLLLSRVKHKSLNANSVDRPTRAIIWLVKMLYDFNRNNIIDSRQIMDNLVYGVKNDKALSLGGNITNKFLKCERLTTPKLNKEDICNIILGRGIEFLSPERRFDAAIQQSINLQK